MIFVINVQNYRLYANLSGARDISHRSGKPPDDAHDAAGCAAARRLAAEVFDDGLSRPEAAWS